MLKDIIKGWTKHLLNEVGLTEVPKFAKERAKVCASNKCGYFKDNTCTKCGCYVPAKTLLENSKCDLNKWQ